MPIRMVPDEEPNSNPQKRTRMPGRSNLPDMRGGGGGSLVPMLLGMLFKNPKLLVVVGALFLVYYFFLGGKQGCQGSSPDMLGQLLGLSTGAKFDPALYDQAEVYEPLSDNVNAPLPEKVSLAQWAPPRLNQGQQGSCVGWASAYAARTIVQAKATGADPRSAAFSPSYLYNQIKIDGSDCQGSYIFRAMENMLATGALPYSRFAYTDQDCNKLPTPQEKQQAMQYRIKGFQRLTKDGDPEGPTDLLAIKQHLSQGSPVVIGMMVGGSFMQEMEGQEIWLPTESDARMPGFGGHAMCVVGFDDYKLRDAGVGNEGAFQIMNSWGPEWGQNGMAWIPYSAFAYFNKEAYAVYPQGEGTDVKPSRFDVQLGFVENDSKRPIALRQKNGRVFRTASPLAKGTAFKVEVTNNVECYTYLFGEETDGTTYVLFPYTEKHSPYCGITGMRLFPKDHSLVADETGSLDVMAVLITNQPFDYPKINAALTASTANGLAAKLEAVLGDELMQNVRYTEGERIGASAPADRNALAVVLEMEKR
jgi:C1A family cysteine protease